MDRQTSSAETLTPSSLLLPSRPTESARRAPVQERFTFSCSNSSASVCLRDEHVQDGLFGIIVDALTSLFKMNCLDQLASQVLQAFEALLMEHYRNPVTSSLRSLVPEVKTFFTPLPFADAFKIYNEKYRLTKRKFIPPTFHEIRHIMNIAQVMAVKHQLKLLTFDGDETLYPDGRNFEDLNAAHFITTLMAKGVNIAVVTAAGYGYQVQKYEARLKGLLDFWRKKALPAEVLQRFFLFGGESNYLLRCGSDFHLHAVPEAQWLPHQSKEMREFFQQAESSQTQGDAEVHRLLNIATEVLTAACDELSLRSIVIKKERAVGLVPGGAQGRKNKPTGSGTSSLKPEILEEVVFRVRQAIRLAEPPISVPYCAFNGGHDVWVDVGNKAEGVRVLQSFLNIDPSQSAHIGDQFSVSGNDIAARDVSPTLWICNPEETKAVLRSLLRQMNHTELVPDDCAMDGVESDDEKDPLRRGSSTDLGKCLARHKV